MEQQQWKIANTTKKKPIICPETGKDLRKTIQKVGHSVSFTNHRDKNIILSPGRAALTQYLDEGLLRMQAGGMISIEEVPDMRVVLKQYSAGSKGGNERKSAPVEARSESKGQAAPMGQPTTDKEPAPSSISVTAPSRETRNKAKEAEAQAVREAEEKADKEAENSSGSGEEGGGAPAKPEGGGEGSPAKPVDPSPGSEGQPGAGGGSTVSGL